MTVGFRIQRDNQNSALGAVTQGSSGGGEICPVILTYKTVGNDISPFFAFKETLSISFASLRLGFASDSYLIGFIRSGTLLLILPDVTIMLFK